MKLNTRVVERLCRDYCILYKKRFEEGYLPEREVEFNRCKSMLGLVQDLLEAQIQTNMGDGIVGIRLVNPENGQVLGGDLREVNYKLDAVLSEIFKGEFRKVSSGLYSLYDRVRGTVSEGVLVCSPDYTVRLVMSDGRECEVTTEEGVKELFRVVGFSQTPLVAIKDFSTAESFRFSPIRIYLGN